MTDALEEDFYAPYTARDVILYALSIGVGSSEDADAAKKELCYVYERDAQFQVFSTFALALSFLARPKGQQRGGIPDFPPPLMRAMGVLPTSCLQQNADANITLDSLPVLHTWQSVSFYHPLPTPPILCGDSSDKESNGNFILTRVQSRFLQVDPKSIGTFVTSETKVFLDSTTTSDTNDDRLLCTMKSTALVLGIDSDLVAPYRASAEPPSGRPMLATSPLPKRRELIEYDYTVTPNQALLYRLGSGDSNKIHVDASALSMLLPISSEKPILHGLCTLGIAARFILQWSNSRHSKNESRLRYLEAKFSKPVFIGDRLSIQLWSTSDLDSLDSTDDDVIVFAVSNRDSSEVVVESGVAVLETETNTVGRSHL